VEGKPAAFGAIDAKCVSWSDMGGGKPAVWAISGPTHAQQDVFSWLPLFPNTTRVGVPDSFPFDWVLIQAT
jgi:hypothetical protein